MRTLRIDKRKKETITLSLDTKIIEQIRRDARENGKSINSAINDILARYILLYRDAEEQRSIIVPNESFRFFLENIDEHKMIEHFTEFILTHVKSIYVTQNIPITLENVLKYTFRHLAQHGGSFHEFTHHVDEEGRLCLIFIHKYGLRWSRILSQVFSKYLEVELNLRVDRILFKDSLMLRTIERISSSQQVNRF